MKRAREWSYLLAMVGVLGGAFGLRLYHLDFQSIWWDEGHSIFVASFPISQIPTLPAMDVHPPAYFVLLHLWLGLVGQSEFALRYLSVSFSLLTVALLGRFAAPSGSQRQVSGLLAATLATFSPLYVTYAQEVRSYALLTCLALGSVFVLWRLLFPGSKQVTVRGQGRLLVLYVLVTAACLYTHYFTIFLLLFQNLVWLAWASSFARRGSGTSNPSPVSDRLGATPLPARRGSGSSDPSPASDRLGATPLSAQRRSGTPDPSPVSDRLGAISLARALTLWLISQGAILLLFLPQLRLALRQVSSYNNPNLLPPTPVDFVLRSWQAYTVGLTIEPEPARWGMGLIAVVLLLGCGLHLFQARSSRLWPWLLFLSAWLVIPLVAYFVVLQRQPSFEPRYLILVTPALFLLLTFALTPPAPKDEPSFSRFTSYALPTRNLWHYFTFHVLRFTFYVLLLLTLYIFLFSLHSYYTNPTYFKDDSAGVANWLAAETTARDLVYVDVPHPFHYYVEQRRIAAPTHYLFVDIHTAAARLTQEAQGRERLFWVTWRGSDTDPRGVIPFLAEKAGAEAGQLDFKGYHLQWFELAQPVKFDLPERLEPVEATFGEVMRLDGAAFSPTASPAEPAWATLHFSLLRETEVNYKVSLRLRGDTGQVVAQVDRDLLNDRHFRTAAWPLDDQALNQAINVYLLPLAPETPPGSYQLEVVVYQAEPPYPSEGVSGRNSLEGVAAGLGEVEVGP